MREILFKAKRIDNNEWIEGYYLKRFDLDSTEKHLIFWSKSYTVWEYAEINLDTLCQFTGLTDKNGVKIWENDILKASFDEKFPQNITYERVAWHEASFYTYENNRLVDVLDKWDSENFEVCGNIFDDPELLESNSAS